ncbi:restriction endonuclease [Vibrio alginolyticus]|uniref:restriction endonuclease n=1 Tax=Vibrio TaxID=662 RepID=UPI000934BFBC|nr:MULTISPECIES: restriction endonuclease [Vibrio]MBS9915943.1 restriction endonuclease [Vibrio alginolyticus]MDN8585818.1 restriction endonuclease [Vibrio alginolyticus]MDW2322421.1 restriction endonuclease [Vibrio sp. 1159]OUJ61987.1 restriction endonuclease [Vibrio parahaemolyticus]TOA40601.1 restriction endonuclease [Vibrio parahaemolyticus]
MKIEVVCKKDEPQKVKGDLFENLASDLLSAQNYEVIQEMRVTGSELDLLCKHRVSQKEIYVECKAHRDKIGAPVISKLIGVVFANDYQEGWLVSTSEFGKDALGLAEKIASKRIEESSKYSFYTPEKVIHSLIVANVIARFPQEKAEEYAGIDNLGSVTLLISEVGRYWCIYTLKGGSPSGVLVYSAKTGLQVTDNDTLTNISKLDSTLSKYDLFVGEVKETITNKMSLTKPQKLPAVVEVQIGDSWDDYRPARPKDFVGRDELQKNILSFLGSIRDKESSTRIFAITGNSGLGKSSLIAKLRDRAKNKHYKNKYFVFAVDIRGAKSPNYINAALLKALKEAQSYDVGDKIELKLSDPDAPLSSDSIQAYLESVERQEKVICLVFDQFEELYSKPELFSIFESAKSLMLDVAALKGNISLGFAWKTDSTTQQDHPAYHMWHELKDLRREYRLEIFDSGEVSKSITTFEKEFDHKITPDIRHQITYACQGFPWLLKKLCINLRESYKRGASADVSLADLDVARLFANDLEQLSQQERTCLDIIANRAPADWSEIIELSSVADVNQLVHKRMVIRSGDRLNIYWDIFKDYLNTGKVPFIPYNYTPTSDFFALMSLARELKAYKFTGSNDLVEKLVKTEKTILNIGSDLVMFGIAERDGSNFKLHSQLGELTDFNCLTIIREKLARHSFKLAIYKNFSGKVVTHKQLLETIKASMPKASHSDKTWSVYSRRLAKYLQLTGFLVQTGQDFTVQDSAIVAVSTEQFKVRHKGKQQSKVFSAPVSPHRAMQTFEAFKQGGNFAELEKQGHRNPLSVLKRFELIVKNADNDYSINKALIDKHGGEVEALWVAAKNEPSVQKCLEYLSTDCSLNGAKVGELIAEDFNLSWKEGSMLRGGNSIRQWSLWVKQGIEESIIPTLPGRNGKS